MSLPQNYTIKEHAYLWRADGSPARKSGTGSIVNHPTLTGGTASATASQVTTAEVPTIPNGTGTPPGTGHLSRVVASGGESGGNIDVHQHSRKKSLGGGNFGFYFTILLVGIRDITGSIAFYAVNNLGFSQILYFQLTQRRQGGGIVVGWNLFTRAKWRPNDNGRGVYPSRNRVQTHASGFRSENKSATSYFGDVMDGWYTKPQVMIWAADNGQGLRRDVPVHEYRRERYPDRHAHHRLPCCAERESSHCQRTQTMQANGWTIDFRTRPSARRSPA